MPCLLMLLCFRAQSAVFDDEAAASKTDIAPARRHSDLLLSLPLHFQHAFDTFEILFEILFNVFNVSRAQCR